MKKSLQGALLSGLVFPGLGQLWLKHYLRGIALIVAVTTSLAVLATKAAHEAFSILEKIEREGGAVDLVAIFSSVSHGSPASDDFIANSASMVLILSWIVGTIDAYFLGRKEDSVDQSKGSN